MTIAEIQAKPPANQLTLAQSRALMAATRKPPVDGPKRFDPSDAQVDAFMRQFTQAPPPVAPQGQTKAARVNVAPAKPKPAKAKAQRVGRVPRTRNGGKWTEAAYWQAVRSALRRGFRFWKPITDALNAAKTPFRGPNGQRFAYLCAGCGKLHPRKAVNVDHIVPCGQLRSLDHVAGFLERLTAEGSGSYQILCSQCHEAKTAKERAAT
jgi:hypothetical protein